MAKPAHTRIVFSGLLVPAADGPSSVSAEKFSWGVNTVTLDGDPEVTATAMAAAYQNTLAGIMPTSVRLTSVKVSNVGADGKVAVGLQGALVTGEWTGSINGGRPGNQLPLQSALCISLMTLRSGPTGRGRVFIPVPRLNLQDDGRISSAIALEWATAFATFLGSLANNQGITIRVVSSKGYTTAVNGVRVGRVIDTIRTRRRDQIEEYSQVPA